MKLVEHERADVKYSSIFKHQIYIRHKTGASLGFWNAVGYKISDISLKYSILL